MFNMTPTTLPAPYELNQQPQQMAQPMQSYARGGSAGHKGLIAAHVNPHELSIMDHLQGGPKLGKGGVRTYSHLEELIKNPHILHAIHKHANSRKHHGGHHAHGGTAAMDHLRAGGRHGDTEIAMIGPHTHHLFNQLAGHATRNPNDGHPEYFDISGALGGLWDTVKGAGSNLWDAGKSMLSGAAPAMQQIAQAAAPSLINQAQQYLGDKGGIAGQMAGSLLPQMAQNVLGPQSQNINPMYQNMGQSLAGAAQAYGQGATPSQAAGYGMQNFGNQMGGGMGRAIQQGGQHLGQGGGWGDAMRQGAQRGYDEMGGRQGMMNSVRNTAMGGLQGGWGGARQAAGNEMAQYGQRMMPRPANQQPQRYPQQGYQQQHNPYEQQEDPYEIYG